MNEEMIEKGNSASMYDENPANKLKKKQERDSWIRLRIDLFFANNSRHSWLLFSIVMQVLFRCVTCNGFGITWISPDLICLLRLSISICLCLSENCEIKAWKEARGGWKAKTDGRENVPGVSVVRSCNQQVCINDITALISGWVLRRFALSWIFKRVWDANQALPLHTVKSPFLELG